MADRGGRSHSRSRSPQVPSRPEPPSRRHSRSRSPRSRTRAVPVSAVSPVSCFCCGTSVRPLMPADLAAPYLGIHCARATPVCKLCHAAAMVLHNVRTYAGEYSTEESMDLRRRLIRAILDFRAARAGPRIYIP